MKTATIKYNPHNAIVSSCLEFLSTLKDVKIFSETDDTHRLNAKEEKELFFAGSKRSMSKHIEKYL